MSNYSCPITDMNSFNFSEWNYPGNMLPFTASLSWKDGLKILFYSVLLVFALVGNVLVILVVYYNQNMRSTINFYLVNLAVADFLVASCCCWVHLVNQLTHPQFVLGAFMCKLNAFVQMTTMTSSVLTLAVISCDRFLAVIFPIRVRIIQQRPSFIIALIWFLAMVASSPFLVYKEHSEIRWRNIVEKVCVENWPVTIINSTQTGHCRATFPSKQIYYAFVTVSLFFLPIVIMAVTYCMIVWRLWITEMPGERSDAALSTQSKAKRKVIKMVFIVLIVFVICWMPLQILILYTQFAPSRQTNKQLPAWFEGVNFFVYFIAYANSAINPIIYGGFNANYRQGIKAILRCRPRSQFPFRQRFHHGGTMITTLSSSCRHKENNRSSFIAHDNSHAIEMKYMVEDRDM